IPTARHEVAREADDPDDQAHEGPGDDAHVQQAAAEATALHAEIAGIDRDPDRAGHDDKQNDHTHQASSASVRSQIGPTSGELDRAEVSRRESAGTLLV